MYWAILPEFRNHFFTGEYNGAGDFTYRRYDGQYSASDNPMAPPAGPGNMTYKGGLELYYGSHPDCTTPAGPHAVCDTQPSGASSIQAHYTYDLNGNNLTGADRTIDYTVFNKPWQIQSTNGTTRFWYSADRNRFKREDVGQRYEYYIGNVEVLKENGQTVYRRSIANTIVRFEPNVDLDIANSPRSHTITDHLGSTVAVHTPDPTAPWQYQTFEPFGKLFRHNSPGTSLSDIRHWTDRGFTGHEDIASTGIIHMNGRIYDPALGRFLQADPFVQEPDYSQSLNRYSYVLNNPLSYTDPSGYFVDQLFSAAFRIIVTAVGCGVGGPVGCGVAATVASLSLGQSLSQSLRNGALATILPAVFDSIGGLIEDGLDVVSGSLLHGAVGAASAAIQGGDPLAGFISGTLTKGFSLASKNLLASLNSLAAQTAIVAVVGGTISAVTGGNFANGAFTAGFGYAFNALRLLRSAAPSSKPYSDPLYNKDDSRIPAGGFTSLKDAETFALKLAAEKGLNVEYGGGIIQAANGNYYITEPVGNGSGVEFDASIGVPKGATLVRLYHLHPGNSSGIKFSENDIDTATGLNNTYPGIISAIGITSNRSIRYFEPGVSEIIKETIPGSATKGNTVSYGREICKKNCF